MILKCEDCVVGFEVLDGLEHNCPNCSKPMQKLDPTLAHDGRIANTPSFIRRLMLKPIN